MSERRVSDELMMERALGMVFRCLWEESTWTRTGRSGDTVNLGYDNETSDVRVLGRVSEVLRATFVH